MFYTRVSSVYNGVSLSTMPWGCFPSLDDPPPQKRDSQAGGTHPSVMHTFCYIMLNLPYSMQMLMSVRCPTTSVEPTPPARTMMVVTTAPVMLGSK